MRVFDSRKIELITAFLFLVCSSIFAAEPINNENSGKRTTYSNPVITDFTYHDSSIIDGEDGYIYSFVSRIVPRVPDKKYVFNQVNIFRSRDMVTWEFYKPAFLENDVAFLNDKKKNRFIWAPNVIHYKGKYLLFVSLRYTIQDVKIGVLESDSIGKDFKFNNVLVSTSSKDVNAKVDSEELIDPFPISDGKNLYLFYGSFRKDRKGRNMETKEKTAVYVVKLVNKDGVWQKEGNPIFVTDYYEGICVIKRKGKYHLFGTCGSWRNNTYQIGYASSKKITGPYKNKEGKLINDALNYNNSSVIFS